MTQEALADRLVNYADAVAAFSVVNGLAFVITLTETELRCSIAHLNWFVISGQITFSTILALGVIALRQPHEQEVDGLAGRLGGSQARHPRRAERSEPRCCSLV